MIVEFGPSDSFSITLGKGPKATAKCGKLEREERVDQKDSKEDIVREIVDGEVVAAVAGRDGCKESGTEENQFHVLLNKLFKGRGL